METESLCKLPGPRARREPRTQIQAYPHWTGIWTILLPEPKVVLSWQDGPWTLSPSVASLGRSQAIFSHLSPPWILPPYGMCTCTHTHTHTQSEWIPSPGSMANLYPSPVLLRPQSFFAERFFVLFDSDGSGTITLQELQKALTLLIHGSPMDKLRFIFQCKRKWIKMIMKRFF